MCLHPGTEDGHDILEPSSEGVWWGECTVPYILEVLGIVLDTRESRDTADILCVSPPYNRRHINLYRSGHQYVLAPHIEEVLGIVLETRESRDTADILCVSPSCIKG